MNHNAAMPTNTPHSPTRLSQRQRWLRAGLLLVLLLATGCSPELSTQVARIFPSFIQPTRTPFQPVAPTPTRTLAPTPTPEPVREVLVWLDPALPPDLRAQIQMPLGARTVDAAEIANLQIGALRGGETQSTWVYALVTPFPSLLEEISLEEIQRAWQGKPGNVFTGPLMLSSATRAAFEARWGPPSGNRLAVMDPDSILDEAWASRPSWALIPFEAVEPRWKVLAVDGLSPLRKDLDVDEYPLAVWFGVAGSPEALRLYQKQLGENAQVLPPGNFDPGKMTTLVMTGVTALARATGYKMDTNGTTYPAQDIQDWLRNADLTHISNEVSFNEDCPKANFTDTSTMFCSRPEYIELLDFIGTDIIELSGNHNNDWGRAASSYSLNLYRERGWKIFGGGATLEEARQPALVEHNGNRLAFIGCNPVGPANAWATDDAPGAAPCDDYEWMLAEIRRLRDEGYLPIVTFQYFEIYVYFPSDHQERNFRAAAQAGAVIVSGSQAHFPQDFEFSDGALIHYGLGNLFFDQMDIPVPGTRKEFIDRHIFYNGRHIQTELLTALLEDYARPRPMTQEEREAFLNDIFSSSGW